MLPPQQARDDSLRARLAQGRDAVTRASEFRACCGGSITRSEEHTSELQSDQISYAVFCLKKKKTRTHRANHHRSPLRRSACRSRSTTDPFIGLDSASPPSPPCARSSSRRGCCFGHHLRLRF